MKAQGPGLKRRMPAFIWKTFRLLFFIEISYLILYPFLSKLSTSLMSRTDILDLTVQWIPKRPTLENYRMVTVLLDYWEYLYSTVFVTLITTLIQLAACVLAAYGLARFKFKGRGLLFFLVIFTLVVPPQTYAISTYMEFRFFDMFGLGSLLGLESVSLVGSPWPVYIMSMGCMGIKNGMLIFILRQFFRNLPNEIEEAAFIDGAGIFRTFFHVMLPNALNAIATVFVFSFVWNWNNYEDASLYMNNVKLMTTQMANLTMVLSSGMGGATVVDPTELTLAMSATGVLVMLPLIIFFIVAQRFFVEGIERTGLTGM